ncbi:MAG: DUF2911 domain-containing protein [Gemmatimonadales bacterium]|jgi:hypothetical protein
MRTTILVALAAAFPVALAGQTPQAPQACTHRGPPEALAQRASPLDSVQVTTSGYTLKVCYSRPYAKARLIMGGLVPLGQPWRLGANEPTRLFLPFAAEVAGVRVEPGEYSLYVVPQQASWEVHVNKAVDRWGIPIDDKVQAQDVGKGTVPVEALDHPVEQLTLSLVADAGGTALVVEWEKTRVRIPIRKVG